MKGLVGYVGRLFTDGKFSNIVDCILEGRYVGVIGWKVASGEDRS